MVFEWMSFWSMIDETANWLTMVHLFVLTEWVIRADFESKSIFTFRTIFFRTFTYYQNLEIGISEVSTIGIFDAYFNCKMMVQMKFVADGGLGVCQIRFDLSVAIRVARRSLKSLAQGLIDYQFWRVGAVYFYAYTFLTLVRSIMKFLVEHTICDISYVT